MIKPYSYILSLIFTFTLFLFIHPSYAQSYQFTDKVVAKDRGQNPIGLFGVSVSLKNNQMLVGSMSSAYFYQYDTLGQWKSAQQLIRTSPSISLDFFGRSVDFIDDCAVVGAPGTSADFNGLNILPSAGSAYVFNKNASGIWMEAQKLLPTYRDTSYYFGETVSINDNYLAISSPWQDLDSSGSNPLYRAGAVYIFKKSNLGTWIQNQIITPTDRDIDDRFGFSLSLSDSLLVIGASEKDNHISVPAKLSMGAAYVYRLNHAGLFRFVQKIESSDLDIGDKFGFSIKIKNDRIIVGAIENKGIPNIRTGAAYIFDQNSGGYFIKTHKFVAADAEAGDWFGAFVDIHGRKAIVGAIKEEEDVNAQNNLLRSGSAYIFTQDTNGTWDVGQKITAPIRANRDEFGWAVSLSQNFAVVGAYKEDEDSLELNSITDAGSAYIFSFCDVADTNITVAECDSLLSPSSKYVWTATGNYDDTVNTRFGCDSIIHINLTIYSNSNPLLLAKVDIQNVKCIELNDGQINLTATGGTPPYKYNWNTGDTLPSLSNLSAGTYSVSITDSLGCSITDSFKIQEPDKLQILLVNYLDVLCYGDANGELNVQGLGGTPPYQYSWSNGEQIPNLTNLSAGTYNLTVIDSNGCSTTGDFIISEPDSLHIKSSEIREATCGKTNAGVELIVEGGSGNVSIEWSNGQTGEKLQNVPGGQYQVTITDGHGCTTEADFNLGDQSQEKVFFANTFTPNGDGINDTYKLLGNPDCFTNANFQVFNRWGEKLFATNKPFEEFWTGSVDGYAPKADVYVFIFTSDEFSESGYVKILH